MFKFNGIEINWHGHDTFTIFGNKKICIDPYKLKKPIQADIILISHNHFDHLSIGDLHMVADNKSIIISPTECVDQISTIPHKEIISIMPYEEITVCDIKIKAMPAYNIDKINPDTQKPFHPKVDNKIGFIINIKNVLVYHTGDSDLIPEMNHVKTDILLIPVSGTYVMTVQEAVLAIEKIKPKIAIPMHYGTIVGSMSDAYDLKKMTKLCEVKILTKE